MDLMKIAGNKAQALPDGLATGLWVPQDNHSASGMHVAYAAMATPATYTSASTL